MIFVRLFLAQLFLLIVFFNYCNGQVNDNYIPPSPAAMTFQKYIDYPVDYSTGIPNISVPLYTINLKDYSFPISVSFHSSGRTTALNFSPLGMNWALMASGIINREIRGRPDEFASSGHIEASADQYNWAQYQHIDELLSLDQTLTYTSARKDSEYDIYSLSVNGISVKFIIKDNGTVVFLTYSPFTLVKSGNQFTLTDNNGIVYKFGSDGNGYGANELNQTLASSTPVTWYLSSIATPSGSKIQFKYDRPQTFPDGWIGNRNYRDQIVVQDNDNWNQYSTTDGSGYTLPLFQGYYQISNTVKSTNYVDIQEFNMCYLSEIVFDNGKIVFNYPDTDNTLHDFLLNSCMVYDNQNALLRSMIFTYFSKLPGSDLYLRNNNTYTINDITFKDKNNITSYKYSFDYYSAPNISGETQFAKGKDWWGYANLVTSPVASNQIPMDKVSIIHGGYPGGYGYGLPFDVNVSGNVNCKNPNFNAKVAGMVKTIHYPTGGTTDFVYESNEVLNPQAQIIEGPGIRIKRISSKDALGNKNEKTYTYQYGHAPVVPNGIYDYLTAKVNLYFTRVPYLSSDLTHDFLGSFKIREYNSDPVSEVNAISSYPVYYQTVTEIDSTNGKRNGKVIYSYDYPEYNKNSSYVTSIGTLSGAQSDYFQPQTYSFNEWTQPHLIGKTIQKYDKTSASYKTISTTIIEDTILNQINIPQMFVYRYLYFGGPVNDYDNTLQKKMMGDPFYYQVYSVVNRPIITAVKKNKSETTITYDDDGNQISSYTHYSYDNPIHVNPTRVTTTASDGKILTNYLVYQGDYSNSTNLMSDLPVEQVTVQDFNGTSKVISGLINTYNNYVPTQKFNLEIANPVNVSAFKFSNRSSIGVLPPAGSTAAFSADSKYKLKQINSYDVKNNPLTVTIVDNISKGYIWGYNNQYPIAEAVNASSTDIAYTSFEEDGKGNWNNYIGTITTTNTDATMPPTGVKYYNLTTTNTLSKSVTNGKKYIISYWNKSASAYTISGGTGSAKTGRAYNGWTYHEHLMTAASTTLTISGTGVIDEVRLYPLGAQMTTYTYQPLVGMTSKSDANNRVTYYAYDGFGRLSSIKDQDGNIIKTYCYNYAGQLTNCLTPFQNIAQSKTFIKNDCTDTASSGSEVEAMVAMGTFTSDSSQEEADAMAKAWLDSTGQSYANTHGECLSLMNILMDNYEHVAGFTIRLTSVYDSTKAYTISFPEDADSAVSLQKIPQGHYNIVLSKTDNAQSFLFTVSGPAGEIQINSDKGSWNNVPVNLNTFYRVAIGILNQ